MASAVVHNAHLLDKQSGPGVTGEVDAYVMKPRLLDLFSGAGGSALGYARVGFEVVGVDIKPQPNYPFEFIQMDALEFVRRLLDGQQILEYQIPSFAGFHASPPCQFASDLAFRTGGEYPNLVAPTQDLLRATGLPYVIENVSRRAGLRDPVTLCGSMFGLGANGRQLRRHRLFECSFPVMAPTCQHRGQPIGVYGTGGGGQMTRGYKGTPEEYRDAMGIDWATRAEIAQAIPPAYTSHVGGFLLAEVQRLQPGAGRMTFPSKTSAGTGGSPVCRRSRMVTTTVRGLP